MAHWNRSSFAYNDVMEAFERALNSEKGIKVALKTRAAAVMFRARCNYWRKQNRNDNRATYPPDHAMHGQSVYDKFILRLPKAGAVDECTVYIQPRTAEDFDIEEIS